MASLLTCAEMAEADRLAEAAGLPPKDLIERAGAAVADVVIEYFPQGRVMVIAGPGNNGADGHVVARLLRDRGWPVSVAGIGSLDTVHWDAADIVIDALFGAGLTRPLDPGAAALAERLAPHPEKIVAVDLPSGLSGDTGQPLGACIKAGLTVTFARKKPGHLLWPGRQYCGRVLVRDIGIPDNILDAVAGDLAENDPDLWFKDFPWPRPDTHKYRRGHALVVTLLAPPDALSLVASTVTAVMVEACDGVSDLMTALADARRNAVLIGPGHGGGDKTQAMVLAALSKRRHTVLDADALTAFAAYPDELFAAIEGPCVLTPHEGEFQKLFRDLIGDRIGRVVRAAERANAVVVLKGPDTVVATPDGRVSVNAHASPWLATAGSGDVLAGLILGLVAQGMPAFEAASAAVWLHGDVGQRFGPGLIAEDLAEGVPTALRLLQKQGA